MASLPTPQPKKQPPKKEPPIKTPDVYIGGPKPLPNPGNPSILKPSSHFEKKPQLIASNEDAIKARRDKAMKRLGV